MKVYKVRREFGQWYVTTYCDGHKVVEYGPMPWSDVTAYEERIYADGYQKER